MDSAPKYRMKTAGDPCVTCGFIDEGDTLTRSVNAREFPCERCLNPALADRLGACGACGQIGSHRQGCPSSSAA